MEKREISKQAIFDSINKAVDPEMMMPPMGMGTLITPPRPPEIPLGNGGDNPESDDPDKGNSGEDVPDSKSKGDFKLTDFMIDLPEAPALSYTVTPSSIPIEVIKRAAKLRVVFLDCPDSALLHSTTYSFIDKYEEESEGNFRKLFVNGSDFQEKTTITPDIQLFSGVAIADHTILVLDLTVGNLTKFFLSSMVDRFVLRDQVKASLESKQSLLIVKLKGLDVEEMVLEDLRDFLWEVPFLAAFLEKHKLRHLEEKLVEQRKHGRWEENNYNFYHELRVKILRNSLEEACEKRDMHHSQDLIDKERENERTVMRKLLDADKDSLHKYIVFLLAFFKEIRDDDLTVLLEALIEDDKKLVKQHKKKFRKVLQECKVQRISSSESDYVNLVLDFTNLYFRDQAIRYFFFEDFYFLREQCNTLLAKGFLLRRGPSYPAYRNLILLVGRLAKSTSTYGFKVLKYTITAVASNETCVDLAIPEHHIDEIFTSGIYDEGGHYGKLLRKKNKDRPSRGRTSFLVKHMLGYSTLAELIQEYANHEVLEADIRQFYHLLISHKQHEVALEIVRVLRNSASVDKINWLKLLINNGNTEIKEKAFKYLLLLAPPNSLQLFDYLQKVAEWIPTREDPETWSSANIYSLHFVLEFLNFKYIEFRNNRGVFGKYPTEYVILAIAQNDSLVEEDYLDMLVNWLFHPQIERALQNDKASLEETKIRYFFSLANLLENWFVLLHGLRREPEEEENMKLFEKIAKRFVVKMCQDRVIKQSMVFNWNQKGEYYLRRVRRAAEGFKGAQSEDEKKAARDIQHEFSARRYLLRDKFIPFLAHKIRAYTPH